MIFVCSTGAVTAGQQELEAIDIESGDSGGKDSDVEDNFIIF